MNEVNERNAELYDQNYNYGTDAHCLENFDREYICSELWSANRDCIRSNFSQCTTRDYSGDEFDFSMELQ